MNVKDEDDWMDRASGLGRREMLCDAFRGVNVCSSPLLRGQLQGAKEDRRNKRL